MVREEGLSRGGARRVTAAGECAGPVSNNGGDLCAGGGGHGLNVDMIGNVLTWSVTVWDATAVGRMATKLFEEFAKTEGFARMAEEVLTIVLDDDRLVARTRRGARRPCGKLWWVG